MSRAWPRWSLNLLDALTVQVVHLYKHGADDSIRDAKGHTPAEIADADGKNY